MNSRERKAYKKFTRTGLAIKGLIYLLSGLLAVIAAAGPGGKTLGRLGVLRWVDELPAGSVLLILISVGLSGYVVLRFMQALKDTNDKGRGWKGLSRRAGYLISALLYLVFLVSSVYILFPQTEVWDKKDANYINKILNLPAGNIAVAVAGAFSFGYGIFEIVRGVRGDFKHHLAVGELKKRKRWVLTIIGGIGYVARGIVLGLVGFLTTRGAFQAYVDNAHFTSRALGFLSSHLGSFVMGTIAAGLALYGIFMFVKAKYYKITIE